MDHTKLAQFFRDKQRRLCDLLGLALPRFSIWDPEVQDSRVQDPKKRGLIWHWRYGPMSRLYCDSCHRPAPIASPESMVKVMYRCPRCVGLHGAPGSQLAVVPGTEAL